MRFTIVTPTSNSERYIGETIESVISQDGDFEIEYLIVDNCSTDRTLDIIGEYASLIENGRYKTNCNSVSLRFSSSKDRGMYDAINKGFALATGDVYAWINSDDRYLPGAFSIVAKAFSQYRDIHWLKGITSYIDESSNIRERGRCFLYGQKWIEKGIYGRAAYFIQQDSVFWRSELWREVGGISPELKLAGDYYLWTQFARRAMLYSLDAEVSCFRIVPGQLSSEMERYRAEQEKVGIKEGLATKMVSCYFTHIEPRIPVALRPFAYRAFAPCQKLRYVRQEGDRLQLERGTYYWVQD